MCTFALPDHEGHAERWSLSEVAHNNASSLATIRHNCFYIINDMLDKGSVIWVQLPGTEVSSRHASLIQIVHASTHPCITHAYKSAIVSAYECSG